jgi:hypothetical protein
MHCHYLRVGEKKACCTAQSFISVRTVVTVGERDNFVMQITLLYKILENAAIITLFSFFLSFFLSFSVWSSVYLLTAGTEGDVARHHNQTHHTRYDSSGRMIDLSQRPLPDDTQHSQGKDIHAPYGIRTRNPSKRAVADPHLRPRGHWDRRSYYIRDNDPCIWVDRPRVTLYLLLIHDPDNNRKLWTESMYPTG